MLSVTPKYESAAIAICVNAVISAQSIRLRFYYEQNCPSVVSVYGDIRAHKTYKDY